VTDQHLVPGPGHSPSVSVFTGADVCELAELTLLPGSVRPVFDQDVWVLDGLADAHRMMGAVEKRWDFTAITNPAWRRMAKELMLALLAPTHEAVARLPHAHRERLSPRTCRKHLNSLIKWLSWLDKHGVRSLAEVTQLHCDQFLQHAFVKHDPNGNPTKTANTPGSVAARVWVLQLVAIYGELFSTDRYQPGFTPGTAHRPTPSPDISAPGRTGPRQSRCPSCNRCSQPASTWSTPSARTSFSCARSSAGPPNGAAHHRDCSPTPASPGSPTSSPARSRLATPCSGCRRPRSTGAWPTAGARPTRCCRSTSARWGGSSATAKCCCATSSRSGRTSNTPSGC
jgi:hypothetical protein